MKVMPSLATVVLLAACSGAPRSSPDVPPSSIDTGTPGTAWRVLDLPILADNVRNDTLLVHTTYDLGDGTFLMAAQNNNYNREGIRLYLYHPKADSSAEILAWSKPGYDSETMLPTFFTTGDRANGLVILANMGERQSWGQEVFWLDGDSIRSLGFMDVAVREWRTEGDSTYQFRTSVAPRTAVHGDSGAFTFTFSGDSVQVYDDLRGGSEDLRAGWDALRRSPLGRDHECARRFEDYVAQCRSGLVLRYLAPRDRLPGALQARLALASAAQVDPAHRDQVMFDFKDFLQRWIETVILPYRDLGYDAVVCNEREGPVSICTQLFVFDPSMLTPPEWLDPDQPRID